jgi:hypothetical protein
MANKKRRWLLIPTILLIALVFLAVAGFFGLEYYATSVLKKEIDRQIEDISDYVRVDYDSLGVNWLAFTVDMHKVRLRRPPLPGRISIDKVAVRDFTSIGINWIPTVVVLKNIVFDNEEFKLTAQSLATSFSLTEIPSEEEINQNWQVLLDNLSSGKLILRNMAFSNKDTQLNVGNLTTNYAHSGANLKNIGVAINDVKTQSGNTLLDAKAFSLGFSLDNKGVLRHISQNIKDFSFQFPADWAKSSPIIAQLTSLGYDRLAFGVDLSYDYQPETRALNIAWDGTAKDMGQLQLDLHLADYRSLPVPMSSSLARLLDYLGQLQTPVENASLRGFTARYRDAGLARRLIKAEAQSQGITPQEFTQNLVGTINSTLALFPIPAKIKDQVHAVNRFLLDPREIQVAITCNPPAHLKKLQEGSVTAILELLGKTEVKITAK